MTRQRASTMRFGEHQDQGSIAAPEDTRKQLNPTNPIHGDQNSNMDDFSDVDKNLDQQIRDRLLIVNMEKLQVEMKHMWK